MNIIFAWITAKFIVTYLSILEDFFSLSENLWKNSVGPTIKNELENEADLKKRLNILLSGGELSQVSNILDFSVFILFLGP